MNSGGTQNWDLGAVPMIEPEMLAEMISTISDIALVIDMDGIILSVLNAPDHTAFSHVKSWESKDIRSTLMPDSVGKFERAIEEHRADPDRQQRTQMNHMSSQPGQDSAVLYSFFDIGPDGAILMMGRDLRPVADLQQQLVNAQIALEQDFERQREYDTRFRVLMKASHDAIVFVSVANGRITDVNGAAAALLGQTSEELTGADFAAIFEDQGKSELMADMAASALSEGNTEVSLVLRGRRRMVLRAAPSFFRAAGERMMLCRLEEQATDRAGTDVLARYMTGLFENGPDALVFANRDGMIVAANDAFLSLTDSAHGTAVKGRSLADFLGRGVVDLKVLLENAARSGRMRLYATKVKGQYDNERPVEISATYLADAAHPAYIFVMRDAEVTDKTRALAGPGAVGDNRKSVVELVGSATLKEIVADTTDVIEKLCIETAVELTDNNRVATAEMLGLSRQSLYVKLRKYGLISRDTE